MLKLKKIRIWCNVQMCETLLGFAIVKWLVMQAGDQCGRDKLSLL